MPKGIAACAPALSLLYSGKLLWLAKQTTGSPLLRASALVVSHDYKLQNRRMGRAEAGASARWSAASGLD